MADKIIMLILDGVILYNFISYGWKKRYFQDIYSYPLWMLIYVSMFAITVYAVNATVRYGFFLWDLFF